MCGIAGSFHPHTDDEDEWVNQALVSIVHRGPDAAGIITWTAATHGHVRLSILDPEPRSNQPFVYRGILLSYVGECWNYRELRAGLEQEGYQFVTTGDTEVVAAMLDRWGKHALPLMEGQFAFAWTESLTGRTWVARDKFGEVPLYLLTEEASPPSLFSPGTEWRTTRWASERKAFGERGGEAVPVPAGHTWEVCDAAIDHGPEAYYDVRGWALAALTSGDPAENVLKLLRQGTRNRLQSDVPVCCLISGGLDSSLILALVKEVKPDVQAYVAAVEGLDSEDHAAALRIAAELEVPVKTVWVRPPDGEAVYRAVRSIEIPMKAQVEIATLCLPLAQQIAADGFKVVLSGEGADELFGGYGNMARKASSDGEWRETRLAQIDKMARGNFIRTNKSFMAHGVEARLPFLERRLVEIVLGYDRETCPPGKGLLKAAAEGVVPAEAIARRKETFQGGAGVIGHLDEVTGGAQVMTYNDAARAIFGSLPRG